MKLKFETDRLLLETLEKEDAPALLKYFNKNRDFLVPWEVSRDESFYTEDCMRLIIHDDNEGLKSGSTLRLWIYKKNEPTRIIGSVALSTIVRGPFQSCYLGYRLDGEEINRGYMTEAVMMVVELAFERLKLHRIEANIIPRNMPSRRMIEKCGFVNEGTSRKYLKINGVWEDHVHMVLLNEAVE